MAAQAEANLQKAGRMESGEWRVEGVEEKITLNPIRKCYICS